ncbi:MAG: amidohydrolase, partial [Anaerolineales bacterium]|nr:amidohydrolase [Anaerolineales bacterium]
MNDYLTAAEELFDYTQALRRDFHRHPELAFEEFRTAGIVAEELQALGFEVTTGVGRTGVVGVLEGEQDGPTVLLRFDMDALPIEEETGAEYASRVPGVMHACGHDGHTAIGLAVANILNNNRRHMAGRVKFVFQPAEEVAGGADSMLVDGVMDNPRPDYTLALHLWNERPLGWFGVSPGPTMAAAESFSIRIKGIGGHGASPHLTIDPVVAAAQLTISFQTIVARNIRPVDPGVLSVTRVDGGHAFNVIPPFVDMWGTIRYYSEEVRTMIHQRMEEIITGTAVATGCQIELNFPEAVPAVVNDPLVTKTVDQVARRRHQAGDDH